MTPARLRDGEKSNERRHDARNQPGGGGKAYGTYLQRGWPLLAGLTVVVLALGALVA